MGPHAWSFRIARIAGIDVRVHATFVLVLVLGAYQWGRPHGLTGALFGVLLMLLLFVCVTLHELAHGVVARFFQLPADEIVLYPFGGAAQVDQDAPRPMQELLVAIAGPAANVMIASLLFVVTSAKIDFAARMDGEHLTRAALSVPSTTTLLVWLLSANLMMAVFNMLPALPTDGGRVFRAVLAMRLRSSTATLIAAAAGQLLSVAMGVYGVVTANYGLALTALMIFVGATAEQKPKRRSALSTLRVGEVFNRDAKTLVPKDKVSRVIDYILTSYQPDFAVFDGAELVGVVTRKSVLDALSHDTHDQEVGAIMSRGATRVDAGAPLDEVYERMTREHIPVVAVFGPQGYLGLVSQDDIAEARLVAGYVQRQTDAQLRTS